MVVSRDLVALGCRLETRLRDAQVSSYVCDAAGRRLSTQSRRTSTSPVCEHIQSPGVRRLFGESTDRAQQIVGDSEPESSGCQDKMRKASSRGGGSAASPRIGRRKSQGHAAVEFQVSKTARPGVPGRLTNRSVGWPVGLSRPDVGHRRLRRRASRRGRRQSNRREASRLAGAPGA